MPPESEQNTTCKVSFVSPIFVEIAIFSQTKEPLSWLFSFAFGVGGVNSRKRKRIHAVSPTSAEKPLAFYSLLWYASRDFICIG